MKTPSLLAIATVAFGIACGNAPTAVEPHEAAPAQATSGALSSGGWQSTWSALPTRLQPFSGGVTLARITDDTIEAVARDGLGQLFRSRKTKHSGAWSAWAAIAGDATIGRPAAVGLDEDFPGSNRYVLFSKKSNGRFHARTMQGDGSPLTGWVQLATDSFASSPGVGIAGGVVWIVGRKQDGTLWAASQTLGGGIERFVPERFSAFTQLPSTPGFTLVGDPAVSGASFWESGGPAFYSRLSTNRFATLVYYTDGTSSGWRTVGSDFFSSEPVVTSSFGVQRTTLFGRRQSGSPSRVVQTTGFLDQWEAYSGVTTETFEGTPAAVDGTYSYGGLFGSSLVHHVVAMKSNGQLYLNSHTNVDPNGGPRLACAEVKALVQKVPAVQPVLLPPSGEVVLSRGNSLYASRLNNIDLDPNPPVLGLPTPAYSATYADDDPTPPAPFVVPQLRAFRHNEFNNQFMVAGWHTYGAQDYATTKGFRFLVNYGRVKDGQRHLPSGTQWGRLFDPYRDQWLENHGLKVPIGPQNPDGSRPADWHLAADLDLAGIMTADPNFMKVEGLAPEAVLTVDVEETALTPAALPTHPNYPSNGSQAEKDDFFERYYRGYARIHTAPVDTARARGYNHVAIYGWAPFPRQFNNLDTAVADPANDFAWNKYGKEIYNRVDALNPSAYTFYQSPGNLAYTLANIDLNHQMIKGESVIKPIRPYYWTLLHGGGDAPRWWAGQTARPEELRAITAMSFFTGIDGHVQWFWSGDGNFSLPQTVLVGPNPVNVYRTIGAPFSLAPVSSATPTQFIRSDRIRIVTEQNGVVSFQRVDPSLGNGGVDSNSALYSLSATQLAGYLQPDSEAFASVFEGMALVKPFEQTLRNGAVKIDVSAQVQFAGTLPVSRRVKRHGVHIVVSNSPKHVYRIGTATDEEIVLPNFDGRPGRTLRIPADTQTRIWVLLDSPCR